MVREMREKSVVGEWSAGLASMTVPDYRFRNSGSHRNSPFLPLPRQSLGRLSTLSEQSCWQINEIQEPLFGA